MAGVPQGPGTSCADGPCRACCNEFGSSCFNLQEQRCLATRGTVLPVETCAYCGVCNVAVDCEPPAMCRLINNEVTETECPTYMVLAAAINGQRISPPTATILASPGDMITAEIFLRCWSQGDHPPGDLHVLRAYQATLSAASFFNEVTGSIKPKNFDQITDPMQRCPRDALVPQPPANPMAAFMDTNHPEFIFAGCGTFGSVDTRRCGYRFGNAIAPGCPSPATFCPEPPNAPKYAGTVILNASNDARGEFNICLDDRDVSDTHPGPDLSFLSRQLQPGEAGSDHIVPLHFECLKVTVVPSTCAQISSSDPPDGSIDARQSRNLDGSNPTGIQQLDLTFRFDQGCDVSDIEHSGFSVSTEPPGMAPTVVDLDMVDSDTIRVRLSDPIPPNKWTRISYDDGDAVTDTCIGYLSGDVNGDQMADSDDVNRLVQCLNGGGCEPHQRNIDRSTGPHAFNPQDLVRELDVLNGANSLGPQEGMMLPASPCS